MRLQPLPSNQNDHCMDTTEDHPLGALAETAYETLLGSIEPAAGIPLDAAHARLQDAGFADEDATYAPERLLNRGYLYEVDGRVFVTDRDDQRT